MFRIRFGISQIILIVFTALVCESTGFLLQKIKDLDSHGNVKTAKVNVKFLNIGFQAIATGPRNITTTCDDYVILQVGNAGYRLRRKPRGDCMFCCKVTSKDVTINLYNKGHLEKPVKMSHKMTRRTKLPYFGINSDTKIIIYIHGFIEVTEAGGSQKLKNAYLSKYENCSVILLDWSELASFPWYFQAVDNTKIVSRILARFLETYSAAGIINMKNVHVIGFSLGAHIAGSTGKYLRSGLRIPRITGLDPAYPGFQDGNHIHRLSKDDADFVDVIHTDGGNFGYILPLGHVDFYPNEGTYYQPGCTYKELKLKQRAHDVISCSHNMAHRLYTDSVYSPYSFPAMRCVASRYKGKRVCSQTDIAYMGIAADNRKAGWYFLKTNMESPYGRSNFDIHSVKRPFEI